ncbi:hypothetical protein J4E91_007544 [Alternaria rosae]|nr:hypothetical protein J4E91_007544 [Alternaria rosae]
MECASRGLAFHSYQTSQEIIYQEHLAKGLTGKYDTLSQQMDQLVHDANSQIKALQDKTQVMQAEQESLENKNFELAKAFKEKTKAHAHSQALYQQLKGKVMASQVAHAAGDEAAFTLQTARGDRFIDRFPGTRTGTANYSQVNMSQQAGGGRPHNRDFSRSSGSSGRQQQGGVHLGPPFDPQLQRRGLGLPALGGSRQPPPYLDQDAHSSYQNSPMTRQPLAGGVGVRGLGNFSLGGKSRRTGGAANNGPLGT